MAILRCTFEEILEGAAGADEARAAQHWLSCGAPLEPSPAGLLVEDAGGLDMRVSGITPGKPRRAGVAAPHSADEPAAASRHTQGPTSSSQQAVPQQHTPPLAAQPRDSVGLAVQRKARAVAAEFQLPEGWRALPQPGVAKRPGGRAVGRKAQHQRQQQVTYMAPEGLTFGSLAEVQAVVDGPVLVPRKLVRWLRQVAADPRGAAAAATVTSSGRAHMLGLQRCRVALVPEERRLLRRRLAAAAGERTAAQRHLRRSS